MGNLGVRPRGGRQFDRSRAHKGTGPLRRKVSRIPKFWDSRPRVLIQKSRFRPGWAPHLDRGRRLASSQNPRQQISTRSKEQIVPKFEHSATLRPAGVAILGWLLAWLTPLIL